MTRIIYGPSAKALESLSQNEVSFIQSLPKAELHAHLNGCIPLQCLQELADRFTSDEETVPSESIRSGIETLKKGVELTTISDFFGLFSTIYALTSTRENLAYATHAVLQDFLDGPNPQCSYLELRSGPRRTDKMTRMQYVETVLDEIELYPKEQAAYILSLDRRMTPDIAEECIDIAIKLKRSGRRIVGIDLCGDPLSGDMKQFAGYIQRAKAAGLKITLHIAETESNTAEETMQLLQMEPDRLGHATFLDESAKKYVFDHKMAIEACLTSNLLCKTVPNLQDHHLLYHFSLNHPVAICTDDTLPFRNSLLGEYAMLMARPPLGLGLDEQSIRTIAEMSMRSRFISS